MGRGEEALTRRRDVRRGIRLGLLLLNAPLFVTVGLFLLRGGDPAELVVAVIGALVVMALELLVLHPCSAFSSW